MRAYLYFMSLFAVFLIHSSNAIAGEDYSYAKDQAELCEEIKKIFISHGLCSNSNECSRRLMVFCSPGRGGIGVQLWGIHDYKVIEKVLFASSSAFAMRGGQMSLHVDAYFSTKEESLVKPFWHIERKIIEVNFKGNK